MATTIFPNLQRYVRQCVALVADALAHKNNAAASQTAAAASATAAAGSATAALGHANNGQASATAAANSAGIAQVAAAAALANGLIFPNTADGITATTPTANKYFWVNPSTRTGGALDLYLNVAGVAEYQSSSTSAVAVAAAVAYSRTLRKSVRTPPNYPVFAECIRDTGGTLRVLRKADANGTSNFLGLDHSKLTAYMKYASMGIAKVRKLPPNYPKRVNVIKDTAGAVRVIDDISPDGTQRRVYPIGGGAGGGALPLPTVFDVFIGAGQSNARGKGEGPFVVVQAGSALRFNPGPNTISALADPFPDNTIYGSMWPAFAKKYFERTGRGVIIVPAYEGGTAQAPGASGGSPIHWGPGGTLTARALARMADAVTALNAAGYCWQFGGIIWAQGETDAEAIFAGTITKQDYKDGHGWMLGSFRATLGNDFPFYLIRTGSKDSLGVRTDNAGFQQVRAAQDEICRADRDVLMAYSGALNFAGNGGLSDGLHLNQSRLNVVGEAVAICAAGRIGTN